MQSFFRRVQNHRRLLALMVLVLVIAVAGFAVVQAQQGGRDGHRPPPQDDQPRHDRPQDGNNDRRHDDDVAAETITTIAEMPETALLGGDNTVFDASEGAFTNPLPLLDPADESRFDRGDDLFEMEFVMATGADADDDGLGPFFNAVSCEACHIEDGRGRAPLFDGETQTGLLIRLALPDVTLNHGTLPDPLYGGQLQDLAIDGLAPEATFRIEYTEISGTFADGTPYRLRQPTYIIENTVYGDVDANTSFSPRVANHMIGLGLLEAVTEETILRYADPNDSDGDGISGRPNMVWDAVNNQMAIGRFGWKANEPNLLQQTAGAFNGDMGITTSLNAYQPCSEMQADCLAALSGGEPELSDDSLQAVTFYVSTLAVPAQRDWDDPQVQTGQQIFMDAQCSSCHLPELETGLHPSIAAASFQTIRPYTDLLLHDMGEGLADGQRNFLATGSEWRTAPLWGIGLIETVNGHTYYLHDGRARNLMEAILWHGGEAQASRDFVLQLSVAEREALIAFLKSL